MRLPRRTFQGAFHHAMNRGYEGRVLFRDDGDRIFFVDILKKIQKLTRLRILAWCLMDTHYHMVLQDNNGKMSAFFKQLNGQYAGYFRQRYGGRGYVFQDRFKSMLIQDDAYLMLTIGYVLNNPVRARLVKDFAECKWSSGSAYFSQNESEIVDAGFVEELFGNVDEFNGFVRRMPVDELPTVRTELGIIIGGGDVLPDLERKADRRQRGGDQNREMRRHDDGFHDPVAKVVQEFERMHDMRITDLDLSTHAHKRLRAELLLLLKEQGGLTYREIAQMDMFGDLSINSLGTLYKRSRMRMKS
ncbi:MAG TPA: hypothetical protein ENN40_01690 [Candidatus Aminicenantes bacterium]|nr:hypothetical protein [Candidatus Aminicenantes bacterium]